ncbi:MAG TPA: hypothetical protein VMA96_05260 [Solirubrobacteraceae bacterium]|nr:hypothetical protein [Solirubrobacteraceae bacterium]
MKRITALVGVLGVLALAIPSIALGSSTCQAYGPQTCDSVSSGTSGTGSGSGTPGSTTVTTAVNSSGTLPFTGLDVVLLVVGGGALLSAGFVVRRLSRRLN